MLGIFSNRTISMVINILVQLVVLCFFNCKVSSSHLLKNNTQTAIAKIKKISLVNQSPKYNVFPTSQPADLFFKAFANFSVQQTNNTVCRVETNLYIRHLKNNSFWAVKMLESWNKYPTGILNGDVYQMGVYDECINIHNPIRAQYCLSDIVIFPAPSMRDFSKFESENINSYHNAWHQILGWVDYHDQSARNQVNFGICIPSSCSFTDLQNTLQMKLDEVFLSENVKTVVTVKPTMCSTSNDEYHTTHWYYIISIIFYFIFFLCCCATFYHFRILFDYKDTKKKNENQRIILAFSVIKNGKELLSYDKNNELNHFNGYKVFTMIFILFGHRFMKLTNIPLSTPENFEYIYKDGLPILLTSMNLVDPFFFMSGFLTYVMLHSTFNSKEPLWMKLFMPFVYRILRMLPSYVAVIAFTAQILPHFGDGPFWKQNTWNEADICNEYWWINLLYINNFIDNKYQCLIASWYISCDVQFYIIGVILGYIYTRNRKIGIGILSFFLIISLLIPFYVTYTQKLDGLLKVDVPFLLNPRSSITFDKAYKPSYLRATPFLVGLAMAFLIEKLKEIKFKMSPTTAYIGIFSITVIAMWIQFYGSKFYQRHRPYSAIENALYASISHCTWPIIGCWASICESTGGFGPAGKITNNRFVVPLGRLSYCVYLVNLIVMTISTGSERKILHSSYQTLIHAWIYDTFKSYLFAAVLYLFVDAPISDLIRIVFRRKKRTLTIQSNLNRK